MLGVGIDYLWGTAILAIVVAITAVRGYSTLERIQLIIVAALVASAGITLILYNPDWFGLLKGAVVPQSYSYPPWLSTEYPLIADQPVWVETTRYVGVIGGAGFDYLAYTSFMRDKAWGQAGDGPASPERLVEIAADPAHPVRRWARAPLVDCSISFLVIVAFSAVFVASGALILGPNHKIPDEKNLLNLQAEFVTGIHPWLLPLYCAGAFLTMMGTLYGTMEVACSIAAEMAHAFSRKFAVKHARWIRRATIIWCGIGACAILLLLFAYQSTGAAGKPPLLLRILDPANLFTGVLLCGLLCLVNLWMDRRFLPKGLRLPVWLWLLNLVSGFVFLGLGVKGYWDYESRPYAIGSLCAMLVVAAVGAHTAGRWVTRTNKDNPK
jgi:Mn2+/Fe2+ NRAMP family transporter